MQTKSIRIASWLEAHLAQIVHAEELADLVRRNADHLRRYLPEVVAIDSVEKARFHMVQAADRASRMEILEWYLFADGVMCGAFRLNKIELENRKTSIAYLLDAGHQGRGIATLAVRAFLDFSFGELEMNRVELTCATDNAPSIRVAERAGFVREGLLRQAERLNGVYTDHYVYGLLRSEFMKQRDRPSIRRAAPSEAAILSDLAQAGKRHWGYPETWLNAWREQLTLTPEYLELNIAYCGEDETGRVVGFYVLEREGDNWLLEHLWLEPSFIGRGVGRQLFEHAMQTARVQGAAEVLIEADPNAEKFYMHMGAQREGQTVSRVTGNERVIPKLRYVMRS